MDHSDKWEAGLEKKVSAKIQARNKKGPDGDFPGGPVVGKSPSAAEDTGSILGQEAGIPHAMEQQSPCTSITEPAWHN